MQKFRGNPGKLRAVTIKADRLRRPRQSVTGGSFVIDPVTRRLTRPLLIATMATALGLGLLVIAHVGTPEKSWYWLTPFLLVVTLIGALTAAWLTSSQSRVVDKTIYRVSEVIVIVALARVVSWFLFANAIPSIDELRLYLQEPQRFFLAGGFLTTALIALVAWWFAGSISSIFCQLDVSEEELRYYTLPPSAQKSMADDQPIQIPRQDLQDAYLRHFLGAAIVLVILAAFSTFEVRDFASVSNPLAVARLGLQSAMLIALLLYFLIGIWLLSHARLMRLNARWLMNGVAVDGTFERSWQRTSLLWLALIAGLAALLPIGDTLPISRLLQIVVNGIFYLASLILSLLGYLFGSLLHAIQSAPGDQPLAPPPQYAPPPYMPPAEPIAPNPIAGIVFSSAFWALMAALVIGAVLFVARERGYKIDLERARAGLKQAKAWLIIRWAKLRGRLRQAGRAIPNRLRAWLPETDEQPMPPPRGRPFLRLGGQSPREQIIYFYLSTVKRAGERGVPRAAAETPIEYAVDLKQHWPETEFEVEELTAAFIEARYSSADISPEAATSVKTRWKRLRDRLRRPEQRPDESGSS